MTLDELISRAASFHSWSGAERIKLVAWHLHVHRGKDAFSNDDVRTAFRSVYADPPDVSVYLPRMAAGPKPLISKVRGGYKLLGTVRRELDAKYGSHPTVTAVSSLLSGLPAKVPDVAERVFLEETLSCYRVKAYRAAIVMAWNLAFDHLKRWLLADPTRMTDFNKSLNAKYPKKGIMVSTAEGFEELKEHEVIETIKHARLVSANVADVLGEKLKRRNRVAHPSSIVVDQHQADDAITDLVNNVVLKLA